MPRTSYFHVSEASESGVPARLHLEALCLLDTIDDPDGFVPAPGVFPEKDEALARSGPVFAPGRRGHFPSLFRGADDHRIQSRFVSIGEPEIRIKVTALIVRKLEPLRHPAQPRVEFSKENFHLGPAVIHARRSTIPKDVRPRAGKVTHMIAPSGVIHLVPIDAGSIVDPQLMLLGPATVTSTFRCEPSNNHQTPLSSGAIDAQQPRSPGSRVPCSRSARPE